MHFPKVVYQKQRHTLKLHEKGTFIPQKLFLLWHHVREVKLALNFTKDGEILSFTDAKQLKKLLS